MKNKWCHDIKSSKKLGEDDFCVLRHVSLSGLLAHLGEVFLSN